MKRAKKREAKRKKAGRRVKIDWAEEAAFKVPIPRDEPERVIDLHAYEVLDTPPEEMFDSITLLASHICGTPIALITLVDSERQWFKSKVGVTIDETSRGIAFCAHAIMGEGLFIVPDLAADKRFAQNPLVRAHPRIRFYAGAPLISRNHHALGTLCVLDRVPRKLTRQQCNGLQTLSRQAMAQLEFRREFRHLERRIVRQADDQAALLRQLNQANARKRSYEERFRRQRHHVRMASKAILNLVDQEAAEAPGLLQKRTLKSIRSVAQSLMEAWP
jgi:GAF domain-containing protein